MILLLTNLICFMGLTFVLQDTIGRYGETELSFWNAHLAVCPASPKNKSPAKKARLLFKRFLSIQQIYLVCGIRITHGLASQSADTEPVYCFIAIDSLSCRYPPYPLYHKTAYLTMFNEIQRWLIFLCSFSEKRIR